MPATFLTGATGFIGSEILRRILIREPERRVYALVRAGSECAAAWRGREVLFRLFMDDDCATGDALGRVRWLDGDLSRAGLGLAAPTAATVADECDELIHAAASTAWDLPLDVAAAVNARGVEGMVELARAGARGARHAPPRLVHVSTAYVAGRRNGAIAPEDLPGPRGPFDNTYEETKASAERFLRERMGELPITVVRPSIVVGDSTTGRTFNFNVLYFPIKLLHRGMLPVIPGRRTTRLDVVPVDYVCDALLALARDGACAGKTYHLTADDDAITVADFTRQVVAWFNEPRHAAGLPQLRPPRLVGPATWTVLHWALRRRLHGRARYLLEAFQQYRPFITTDKRFLATGTREALGARAAYPPVASYLRRVVDYAVTREWGKSVSWDPSVLKDRGEPDLVWRCANGHQSDGPGFTCRRCGARMAPLPSQHAAAGSAATTVSG